MVKIKKGIKQEKIQLKDISSDKIRYCYFLKNSIVLKKVGECTYQQLRKWCNIFVFIVIVGGVFSIAVTTISDVFLAFEIPLALWIIEDLLVSYNNEKQLNYEKINKFVEVAGELYDNGELNEYQDLKMYYEYLLGIYDFDHVEDEDLEPLLPTRYKNKN